MLLIGAFKILKCLFLILAALITLRLAHGNSLENLNHWSEELRVDPHNRLVHHFLAKLLQVNPKTLHLFAVGSFLYSGIFATEGVGLLLRKRWAEYFTVISTSLLIPLEIYEVFHHPRWPHTLAKIILLIANFAIVVYLIQRLRSQHKRQTKV